MDQLYCTLCGKAMAAEGTELGDWSKERPNTRLVKTYRQCPDFTAPGVTTDANGTTWVTFYYTPATPTKKAKKARGHDRVLLTKEYVDQTPAQLATANETIKGLREQNAKLTKKVAKAGRALGLGSED